jgi:ABC-type dipeptide/oligopeptide/nickel transport system permease subunit
MTDANARSDFSSSEGGSALLASFATYAEAQRLVDTMSDEGFPVEHVRIVGENLRTVEYVTGRLDLGKAALAGAASGAWIGLLIGLLLGLFTVGESWVWVMLVSLLLGTIWGAALGMAGHWVTKGVRDFSSFQTMEAGRYDVYVDADQQAEAVRFIH